MQLNQLQSGHARKKKKRVGRGGKRGTYSGKGHKGQRARAGRKLPPAQIASVKSMPKFRGSRNKRRAAVKPRVISLGALAAVQENVITGKLLAEKGFIKNKKEAVKLVSGGEINRFVKVEGIPASKAALKKLEGARLEVPPAKEDHE